MTLTNIWQELSVYSIPEIIAVLASLTYVILAPVSIAVAGLAGIIGSSIYVVVFFQYQLYMDSALQYILCGNGRLWLADVAESSILKSICLPQQPRAKQPLKQWRCP